MVMRVSNINPICSFSAIIGTYMHTLYFHALEGNQQRDCIYNSDISTCCMHIKLYDMNNSL